MVSLEGQDKGKVQEKLWSNTEKWMWNEAAVSAALQNKNAEYPYKVYNMTLFLFCFLPPPVDFLLQ